MDKHTLEQHILADRTDFQGVNLVDRDLQGARLEGINLQGARLEGINLQGANLQGTNLEDADLENANLQRANLQGAKLKDAFLQDATAHGANFAKANLYDAFFWRAGCNHAIFESANLRAANFMDTDLYRADFRGANLYRTDFRGANLKDALWIGANTEEAIFSRGSELTRLGRDKAMKAMSEPVAMWEFRTNAKQFDGERILREAAEAGVGLVEIQRGNDTVRYASQAYCRRLIDADMMIVSYVCYSEFPEADQAGLVRIGNEVLMTRCQNETEWRRIGGVKLPNGTRCTSASKIHSELLRAESVSVRTTVACWK